MVRTRHLGTDGPTLPEVGFGTSPLGGMARTYGYDVDGPRAIETVQHMLRSGVHFIDTANEYGDGASEERIGAALASTPAPDDLVIASKADPVRGGRVFDGARVFASFDESAARLGCTTFPLYFLHDPDRFDFATMTAPGGAVAAMTELKATGRAQTIGVAGGELDAMRRYVDTGAFDVLLTHNRYNLLDRSADSLITHAVDAGLAVVNAAPYASGILAKPLEARPRFQYREADEETLGRVRWLQAQCDRYDVPLAALALQFSTRDVRVTSTIVGVSAPARVDALLANLETLVPQELWDAVANWHAGQ